ncbi:envelope glycoprotein O [Saimiriine betaherpesvirus 4]|uniref:Envelope glycoprotein O n=1 Tax=Saimiriine betaherpesvirus 4 TaxID=1535247 RepID=G8XSX8_9BETA|nr:envelope glycoprotein O [Saimiriine betaherpesvirus 4]AEV80924.1 envelope glycoprotein O [Saimiriine betaherpesvirus 4]
MEKQIIITVIIIVSATLASQIYIQTPPLKLPPESIQAGPFHLNNTSYFWMKLIQQNRKNLPKNFSIYKNKYLFIKYNPQPSNKTMLEPLTTEPCGYIPSSGCFHEILNVSVKNYTGEKYCNLTTYNPMLYNIPRWNSKIRLPGNITYHTDSQSLYFFGLTTLITKVTLKTNCSNSFNLLNAMSTTFFRLRTNDFNRTRSLFRRLKRKQTSGSTNIHNSSNYNDTFTNPVSSNNLKKYATWMYLDLNRRLPMWCNSKRNYSAQIVTNSTVYTPYGNLDLSELYTPSYNTTNITTFKKQYSSELIQEYLDALFFIKQIDHNITVHSRFENSMFFSNLSWWTP